MNYQLPEGLTGNVTPPPSAGTIGLSPDPTGTPPRRGRTSRSFGAAAPRVSTAPGGHSPLSSPSHAAPKEPRRPGPTAQEFVTNLVFGTLLTIAGLEILTDQSGVASAREFASPSLWDTVLAFVLVAVGFRAAAVAHPLMITLIAAVWGMILWMTDGAGLLTLVSDEPVAMSRLVTIGPNGLLMVVVLAALTGVSVLLGRMRGASIGRAEAARIRAMRIRTEEQAGSAEALEAAESAARSAPPAEGMISLITAALGAVLALVALSFIGEGQIEQVTRADAGVLAPSQVRALVLLASVVLTSALHASAGFWGAATMLVLWWLARDGGSTLQTQLLEVSELIPTLDEWALTIPRAAYQGFAEIFGVLLLAATSVIGAGRNSENDRLVNTAKGLPSA